MGKRPGSRPKKRVVPGRGDVSPISIVVGPVTSAEHAAECLERIASATEGVAHDVVVTGLTPEQATDLGDVRATVVVGAAEPDRPLLWNAGIAAAGGELVALLGPDIVPAERWLRVLAKGLRDATTGVVGGRIVGSDDLLIDAGFAFDEQAGFVARGGGAPSGHFEFLQEAAVAAVDLRMALVSRAALDAAGPFDEMLGVRYGSIDFCLRARLSGLGIAYRPDTLGRSVRHRGSQANPDPAAVLALSVGADRFHSKWTSTEPHGDPLVAGLVAYGRRLELDCASRLQDFGVPDPARLFADAGQASR